MKKGPKPVPIEKRFWQKVDKNGPGGCWLWTASHNGLGYGKIAVTTGVFIYAHRYAYETLVGPIPDDRPHLDHLCRVPSCVNPEHLEPVTCGENLRRGKESRGAAGWQQPHGSAPRYRSGCSCNLCRAENARIARERRHRLLSCS